MLDDGYGKFEAGSAKYEIDRKKKLLKQKCFPLVISGHIKNYGEQ